MRARIDDNAHEALQFLMLGSAIVLGARLLFLAAIHFYNGSGTGPVDEAIAGFAQGYLLGEGRTMVVHGMAPGGRLALALLFTVLGGITFAVVAWILSRLLKSDGIRWAVLGARIGLVVTGAWGLYSALSLPPATAHVQENGILLRSRSAFLGELSWPVPSQELLLPWDSIEGIETRSVASSYEGCGSREQVVAMQAGVAYPLAALVPEGRDCNEALHNARGSTTQLASALSSLIPN